MELLYLSRAGVEGLGLSMRDVLRAVDGGFAAKGRGLTEMPPKPGIHTRPDCFIHAMPAYVQEPEVAGLKWVSGYPPNPAKGLPYITGLLVLNDPETGVPLAVMDCAWITAMRTGRAPASRRSTSPGRTARSRPSSAAASRRGRRWPRWSRRCRPWPPCAATTSCRSHRRVHRRDERRVPRAALQRVPGAAAAVREADVAVTAIPIVTEPAPELDAGDLREGALAVSLDYDSAWTSAAMRGCDKFCADDVPQLLATRDHGVYFGGIPEAIHADLGELAAGLKPGREHAAERIFSGPKMGVRRMLAQGPQRIAAMR